MALKAMIIGKNTPYCAVCRHWYDPGNSHIRPIDQRIRKWEIDTDARCMCMKKKLLKNAMYRCSEFERKIP